MYTNGTTRSLALAHASTFFLKRVPINHHLTKKKYTRKLPESGNRRLLTKSTLFTVFIPPSVVYQKSNKRDKIGRYSTMPEMPTLHA